MKKNTNKQLDQMKIIIPKAQLELRRSKGYEHFTKITQN